MKESLPTDSSSQAVLMLRAAVASDAFTPRRPPFEHRDFQMPTSRIRLLYLKMLTLAADGCPHLLSNRLSLLDKA